MLPAYTDTVPERAEIDAHQGALLLEFGSNDCGICQAATPLIALVLATRPGLPHLRIEDGKGKRLGRSYTVKLWPTLILVHDGQELARLVRPAAAADIENFLRQAGVA